MNTSQFMDKQIMDLTAAPSSSSPNHVTKDFLDLMKMDHPQNDDHDPRFESDNAIKKDEILPSYDFHPIRPLAGALTLDSSFGGSSPPASASAARGWGSDSKSGSAAANNVSSMRSYASLDSLEPAKVILEKDRNAIDAAILSEVDRTMKKHVDNLLHALEGVNGRLTQLESRTHHLENSMDDLKVSVGNNHGSADGKMRQLENILREVQSVVQLLKDKQDTVEVQLELAKLQASKPDQQQSETQNTGQNVSVQQGASAPPQSHQQLPLPGNFPQSVPPLPVPVPVPVPVPPPAVPPPSLHQQNLAPPAAVPNQFPQNQIASIPQREPYYGPTQTQEPPPPQYQAPPPQQAPPPPSMIPHQPYQPPSQPQYSQPHQASQHKPSLGQHPEEVSYAPSHNYPAGIQPSSQPPGGAPLAPQYYGAPPPSPMYEPQSSRSGAGFPPLFGQPTGPTEPYAYGGSPSQYGGNPAMKQQQLSSPAMPPSGGSGYPQLPTGRVLPHALPTASSVSGGSGSSGNGNKVPIDDVVDRVASMGFPREHVRATVRKLTENGQSVDLNIVLDKLMNDGDIQPPRGGWFGR
ncbi:hypothetical protein K2173_019946 [Erythroxylum novogranatense]|uniref:DUF1421 domain-containing protein n=1 Tax=Erythroxylum novogranatense TaxID=1862640 RepID=A0AAV8U6L1_9ROSI|nr:hypothetical protein K2173_019946 [Erythroxylum novogranatense]